MHCMQRVHAAMACCRGTCRSYTEMWGGRASMARCSECRHCVRVRPGSPATHTAARQQTSAREQGPLQPISVVRHSRVARLGPHPRSGRGSSWAAMPPPPPPERPRHRPACASARTPPAALPGTPDPRGHSMSTGVGAVQHGHSPWYMWSALHGRHHCADNMPLTVCDNMPVLMK